MENWKSRALGKIEKFLNCKDIEFELDSIDPFGNKKYKVIVFVESFMPIVVGEIVVNEKGEIIGWPTEKQFEDARRKISNLQKIIKKTDIRQLPLNEKLAHELESILISKITPEGLAWYINVAIEIIIKNEKRLATEKIDIDLESIKKIKTYIKRIEKRHILPKSIYLLVKACALLLGKRKAKEYEFKCAKYIIEFALSYIYEILFQEPLSFVVEAEITKLPPKIETELNVVEIVAKSAYFFVLDNLKEIMF